MTQKTRHKDDPRGVTYTETDSGCEIGTCLECPLPLCKYDDYSALKRYKDEQGISIRGKILAEAQGKFHLSLEEAEQVAVVVGVSSRHVYKILSQELRKDDEIRSSSM